MAEGEGGAGSQTDAYDQGRPGQGEAYLAAALGQNNADVQVNATLSYDQVSTTTQSIVPGATRTAGQLLHPDLDTATSPTTAPARRPGGTAGTITTTPVTTIAGGERQLHEHVEHSDL